MEGFPVSLVAALVLAGVHIGANKLRFLQVLPRSKWLSFAGGAAVAYIFLHLLPELQEWQEAAIGNEGNSLWGFVHHPVYLVALLGLTVFYGLERMVKVHQAGRAEKGSEAEVFWLHISSFSIYNGLIGYLLHQNEDLSGSGLWLFVLAMGLHFLVNDIGLLDHHQEDYLHRGRWIVSGAVLAGWLLSFLFHVSELAVSLFFGFVAGSVVLNVLKEELPEERKSNFWAFLVGVVFYASLLLLQVYLSE